MGSTIYRTGRISAHSQTGAANGRDLLNNLVKGCLLLGAAFPGLDIELSLAPVDYISQAIVHLSLQSSCLGKDFHLVSPHPVPWRVFMQMVGQGYSLSEMDYEAWLTLLNGRQPCMRSVNRSIRLWMVLHASNHLLSRRPRYTLPNSSAGLQDLGFPSRPAYRYGVSRQVPQPIPANAALSRTAQHESTGFNR